MTLKFIGQSNLNLLWERRGSVDPQNLSKSAQPAYWTLKDQYGLAQNEADSVNSAFHSLFGFVTHSASCTLSEQQVYTR